MFDVAPTELIVLGTVALLVIPPKDLPRAMRTAGYWVGRARGVARQFRSGFDNMVREAELEEMEKRWRAENERIMREHPPTVDAGAGDVPQGTMAEPLMTPQPTLSDRGAPASSGSQASVSVEHPVIAAADDAERRSDDAPRASTLADGKASS